MLQQTTVATVQQYYPRFLQLFPDAAALAAATEEQVLHVWQGLGYYRRARHLQAACRHVVDQCAGAFPRTLAELRGLPGVGRYTAGALASFAFDEPAPILEANTLRVWGRLAGVTEVPTKAPVHEQLWHLATLILPATAGTGAGRLNHALMDLGSLVCRPERPDCAACPFQQDCTAYAHGNPEGYPGRVAKAAPTAVTHVALVLWADDRVLVRQVPTGQRWAGLWEFPRVEVEPDETEEAALARAAAETARPLPLPPTRRLLTLRHAVTRYRVTLNVYEARLPEHSATPPARHEVMLDAMPHPREEGLRSLPRWLTLRELPALPFSTPQRAIVSHLLAAPPACPDSG